MQYGGEDNLEIMRLAENNNRHLISLLSQKLGRRRNEITDFGSGNGMFASLLAERGFQIDCLEPAENMQRFYLRKPYASLEEIASVSFIYSLNVLEHIEDDEVVLQNMAAALPAGGGLFLYVPAFPLLYSSMDKKVGHFRRYTRRELIAKVQKAGFEVKECRYADFGGFFASLLYKWLPETDGSLNPRALTFYDRWAFPLSIWLDKLTFGRLVGKNLYLYAEKR